MLIIIIILFIIYVLEAQPQDQLQGQHKNIWKVKDT